MHETYITVRGYELDSYNHVNNSVYLNYIEQARWEILRDIKLLDEFKKRGLLLVVAELQIRYSQESKIFDELLIKTKMFIEGPYIIFRHRITNAKTNIKIATSTVKTIPINNERIPCSIPEEFRHLFDTK